MTPALIRIWGRNEDGSPYVVGMTVGQLRKELEPFTDTDEICMCVDRESGRGVPGKLKAVEYGASGQLWLTAHVLDESLE